MKIVQYEYLKSFILFEFDFEVYDLFDPKRNGKVEKPSRFSLKMKTLTSKTEIFSNFINWFYNSFTDCMEKKLKSVKVASLS